MTDQRLLPVPDALTQPWWEAARQGQLLIQRCTGCGALQWYPRTHCKACWSFELDWVPASGLGRIKTFTRTGYHGLPGMEDTFVFAIVELEEGVCMSANILNAGDDLAIGQPVQVTFEALTDALTLPQFQPITGERA